MGKIISTLKNNKLIYSTALKTKYFINKNKAKKNRIGNIATFHTTRCGSSVVGLMLDQHPDIHWNGEIIRRMKFCTQNIQKEPKQYIKYRMYYEKSKYYGFETTMQHLEKFFLNIELEDYITMLKNMGITHFVNLQRKNHLRKLISNTIGRKTRKFYGTDKKKLTTISLNLDKNKKQKRTLIERFEKLTQFYNKIDKLLENKNSIKLTYEDDILNDPHIAYNKIINFIGLDNFTPKITLKKQNPYSLKEILENYDEVKDALTGTKYEWMLYE